MQQWVDRCASDSDWVGRVGSGIRELPWSREYFHMQKEFMLATLDGIRHKTGWDTLDYEPNEDMVFRAADGLRAMIEEISPDDIDEKNTRECIACNDK